MPGARRPDHEGGFRDLPAAPPLGALASTGAGSSDGQPLISQGWEGQGDHRRQGLPAHLPSALFARSQPHRRSVRKLKALVRKAGARTCVALIEAIGWALEAITAKDARGFFEHRGYRATTQLL